MSGDGYEYPDEAGYPDGTGTLHEGTEEAQASTGDEADDADATETELNEFAMEDEEDLDGNV
ncbi:hypothetical protein [Agromyces kandeliae]|uniref:Uncharacterized protein n=1 Tax=Agromyces kandeliae TaxID=2666141 RepID=A0A6L5QYK8_9MICO|nr:hypothetical protein [Agromyces kandeliae]MRX42739.1 hypothetical protein [Agromyces kandeliae]